MSALNSSVPLAGSTSAMGSDAGEVAAVLRRAVEEGTAVEAFRRLFSTTVGAELAELLMEHLGTRKVSDGDDEEKKRLREDREILEAQLEAIAASYEGLPALEGTASSIRRQ